MFKDVIKKEFEKGALKVNLGNDNIVEILLDEVRAGTAGDFLSYYFASAKIHSIPFEGQGRTPEAALEDLIYSIGKKIEGFITFMVKKILSPV